MEELRQLDSKFKQLVQNVNKSEDEFFKLLSRYRDSTHACVEFKQCELLKCLYVWEQFHGSICRSILEQQIKIKELQEDGKPVKNEFEMLRSYVNFKNYIEDYINPKNEIDYFIKAAVRAGFEPEMIDLLKKHAINEVMQFK